MKITMAILFLLVANILFGQQSDKILTIRKAVSEINYKKNYKVKTLSNDYFTSKKEATDNGQELKGYYQGDTLKKIAYSVGLSYGMKTFEYYFSDGHLIFAFEKEKVFPEIKDAPVNGSLNYGKLVPSFEGRYYFESGKIFQSKIKGRKRFAGDDKKDILRILARVRMELNEKRR